MKNASNHFPLLDTYLRGFIMVDGWTHLLVGLYAVGKRC